MSGLMHARPAGGLSASPSPRRGSHGPNNTILVVTRIQDLGFRLRVNVGLGVRLHLDPQVCRTMAFLTVYMAFGPLLYVLLRSRYGL